MVSKFLLKVHLLVFRVCGPDSNRKEKRTNESKHTATTQCLVVTRRSFVTGLVSATVTGVTNPWVKQLVDVVGAAVLYLNEK